MNAMPISVPHFLRPPALCFASLASFVLLLTQVNPARACSCYYPPEYRYADHFETAQEVVVGQARFSFRVGDSVYIAFRPEVDSKGCLAAEQQLIWIETAADEAECGVVLQDDERYMIHLNGQSQLGTYALDLCTFHKPLTGLSLEELMHLLNQRPSCPQNPPAER